MLSLEKLLKTKAGHGLGKIIQRAQNMDALARQLQASLAPELAGQLISANLRENGELVVVCRSSAGAARLRFEADRLMATARDSGAVVNGCRVRVGR